MARCKASMRLLLHSRATVWLQAPALHHSLCSAPCCRAGGMFIEWLNRDGTAAQSLTVEPRLGSRAVARGGGFNTTASYGWFAVIRRTAATVSIGSRVPARRVFRTDFRT